MISRWVRFACCCALALAALATAAAPATAADDFKPIFDGKSLAGWDGNPDFWRAEDGVIAGETTKEKPAKGNTFLIWRKGTPGDFELKLEFRILGGNSGVQIRSFEDPEHWGKWVVGGYQADMDFGNSWTGAIYGERYRGILCAPGQKTVIGPDHKAKVVGKVATPEEVHKAIKTGDWNEYVIVAKGFHFVQKINGTTTADMVDEDKQQRKAKGIIALQLHAGPPMKVQFRNLKLKKLPAEKATASESTADSQKSKKIVFVAGGPSHGYAAHTHFAGCTLLAKRLKENVPGVQTVVCRNGWPKDPKAFDGADAIVIYSDGGGGHPIIPHLDEVAPLMKKGVGLGLIHYAVEVPKGKAGNRLLDWTGGYFEPFWSVNPFWKAEFKTFPDHPIARGVKPFSINDEWYYHMRFAKDAKEVTEILSAVPPESTRQQPDGPHSGNPAVRARKGMSECVCWARQREDGGRGFGFTGGHDHWNWACDSFRTTVLNAIVWIAGLDVPPGGVPSKTPTMDELLQNQDYPQPKNFDRKRIEAMIKTWNASAE